MQGCLFLSLVTKSPLPFTLALLIPDSLLLTLRHKSCLTPPSPPQITCPNLRHLDQGMKGLRSLWYPFPFHIPGLGSSF